jgi:holliday junction DNA helicase RuvA
MIGFLSGVARFSDAESVCIDVGGVGYRVLMPVSDLARIAALEPPRKLEAFVHTHVREDAIVLFGFTEPAALELFERLLAVSGVGPKTALAALSGMSAVELVRVIAERDEARLTKVPGVGKKTAARIVLELGDKLAKESLGGPAPAGAPRRGGALDDLRSALANLGYKAPQIDRAVQKVRPLAEDGQGLSELVREALKHVG